MSNDSTLPVPGAMPLTMSSREIAELTGKEHKNVIRDIRGMLGGLYGQDRLDQVAPETRRQRHREFCGENATAIIGGLPGDGSEVSQAQASQSFQGVSWERDARGYITLFRLDKEHTITLVTGYDVVLRKKIIDRWIELEGATVKPVDVRDPGQLAAIALQLIEVNKELQGRAAVAEAKIEADKPKTGFFDRFMNADGLFGLQNAGRILIEPPNKFVGWLKQQFLFYQGGSLVPRAQYRTMGIFEVKATVVDDKARYQTYVTPKGLQYLAKKLGKSIPGLEEA